MMGLANMLDGVELFDGFSREERAMVAARGRVVDVPAKAVLVRQDDEADALFVLLDGNVRVTRWDAAGGDVEIGRRYSGECFGEMALLDGGRRSATVETVTPCRLFVLSRHDFFDVIAPSPAMLAKLLRELSLKIRDVSERVVQEDLDRRTHAAEAELARHRAITQVVTGLAHELNTPLGISITTASHIAATLPPECRAVVGDVVDMLQTALQRCAGLMETFATIAALHDTEPLEPMDLFDAIAHSAALFAIERPDARLDVRLKDSNPAPWLGYRGHLERVLRQLLDNVAAHAYGPGKRTAVDTDTRRLDIGITADTMDGRPAWQLTLRDYGHGIGTASPRQLFEAFVTTRRGDGFKGLGLTIVYNTVTGPLSGQVRLDPANDELGGCVVTILLPTDL